MQIHALGRSIKNLAAANCFLCCRRISWQPSATEFVDDNADGPRRQYQTAFSRNRTDEEEEKRFNLHSAPQKYRNLMQHHYISVCQTKDFLLRARWPGPNLFSPAFSRIYQQLNPYPGSRRRLKSHSIVLKPFSLIREGGGGGGGDARFCFKKSDERKLKHRTWEAAMR